jgi:hypothetical protein
MKNILGIPIQGGLIGIVGECKTSFSYVIVLHHIRKKKWLGQYLHRRGSVLSKWLITGTNEPYTTKVSQDTILREVGCAVDGDRFILAEGEHRLCERIVKDTFTN